MVIKTAPVNQSNYGKHRFENIDSMIEKIHPSFWESVENKALPTIIRAYKTRKTSNGARRTTICSGFGKRSLSR